MLISNTHFEISKKIDEKLSVTYYVYEGYASFALRHKNSCLLLLVRGVKVFSQRCISQFGGKFGFVLRALCF
jgi:hypothetical protein